MWTQATIPIAGILIVLYVVRTVLRLRALSSNGDPSFDKGTQFVVCSTSHTRIFPVRHSFRYPLLYVFFPLHTPETNFFFEIDKWRIFHIQSDDYLGSPPCGQSIPEKLHWHLKRHVSHTCTTNLNVGNYYNGFDESLDVDHAPISRILIQSSHRILHIRSDLDRNPPRSSQHIRRETRLCRPTKRNQNPSSLSRLTIQRSRGNISIPSLPGTRNQH
jgi:hypothetical protein